MVDAAMVVVPQMERMTVQYLKTPMAADQLGVPAHCLMNLIRFRKIVAPGKDSSGDYVWVKEDLDRARQALAERRAKKAGANGQHGNGCRVA